MLNLVPGMPEPIGTNTPRFAADWAPSTSAVAQATRKRPATGFDLVALSYSEGAPREISWMEAPDPYGNGSLLHRGDVAVAEGDNTWFSATLDALPMAVDCLVVAVWAFRPGSLASDTDGITLNVYDLAVPELIGSRDVFARPQDNVCITAKVDVSSGVWEVSALDATGRADNPSELLELGRAYA